MALPPLYDPEAVKPMWKELELVGINPLNTPEQVDEMFEKPGTLLLVLNSVCGCAAGGARPGVSLALQHSKIPDHLTTVFAGVDRDAVEQARSKMPQIPPSSPCIALFKDGNLLACLERRHIEQMNAQMIAQTLSEVFDQFCERQGPSVSPEEFAKIVQANQCGSTVPRFGQ